MLVILRLKPGWEPGLLSHGRSPVVVKERRVNWTNSGVIPRQPWPLPPVNPPPLDFSWLLGYWTESSRKVEILLLIISVFMTPGTESSAEGVSVVVVHWLNKCSCKYLVISTTYLSKYPIRDALLSPGCSKFSSLKRCLPYIICSLWHWPVKTLLSSVIPLNGSLSLGRDVPSLPSYSVGCLNTITEKSPTLCGNAPLVLFFPLLWYLQINLIDIWTPSC